MTALAFFGVSLCLSCVIASRRSGVLLAGLQTVLLIAVAAITHEPQGVDGALTALRLIFHLLVLLGDRGLSLNDVRAELARREGVSGIEEKAGRTPE